MSDKFPDEHLQSLARMQHGKRVEQIQTEFDQERRELEVTLSRKGVVQSGSALKQHLRLHNKRTEAIARSLCDIWVELFMRKDGKLTRKDVDYILSVVQHVLDASKLKGRPFEHSPWVPPQAGEEMRRRHKAKLDDIENGIRRDLEIMLGEQALPPKEDTRAAAAGVMVVGNTGGVFVNTGTIDASTKVSVDVSVFRTAQEAIEEAVANEAERAAILERLSALEQSKDSRTAYERYAELMNLAAAHITVLQPFLPALYEWVKQLQP